MLKDLKSFSFGAGKMKKLLLAIAIVATLGAGPAAFGQAAGPKGGLAPAQGGPGGGRMGGGMQRMQKMRDDIFAQLNLTADQKKKIKTLDEAQAKKVKSMMADAQKPGADRSKMRDTFMAMRKDYDKSLAGILSKDQKKKYDVLLKAAREKFRAQRGAGKGQAPKQ